MNKHVTTLLALIAISVPVFAAAQTAPAARPAAGPAKITPVPPTPPLKSLPEKIIRDRVSNVISALQRHADLLDAAIVKVSEQSVKFKEKGGDVTKANADIAAARVKLDEVKKDIADLQNMLKTIDLKDKTKTPAIRAGVAKTTDALRACRTTLVEGIQKLKAVKVTLPATPTPAPKAPVPTPKP